MADNNNNGNKLLEKTLGFRKMISCFVSMVVIFAASAIFQWLSVDGLTGDQFVSIVYANMWIVLGLMGGNALSHIAQSIKK